MGSSYLSTDTGTSTTSSGGSSGSGGSGGSGGSSLFDPNTTYRMVPQQATAESVDVCNNSQSNGNCVQQYSSWNSSSQKFYIRANGSNWMISMHDNAAKCFGLVSNQTGNGTAVEIQDCNAGNSLQTWTAVPVSGMTNTYQFKNVGASGRCMNVTGQSTANSARISVWDCYGQNNEKFAVSAAP
jgi:hypothetical protein